jgi:Fe-S cluster biosynthesis and repair protein YggX
MSAIHSEYISKLFLFDFDRKPENIPTPETLLCSLYRQLELSSHQNENGVWDNSVELNKIISKENHKYSVENLSSDNFRIITEKLIASNKSKEQEIKNKNHLYLKPLVPEIASVSHSARLSGNPWNPGAMILEEILNGCSSLDEYEEIRHNLKDALSITISDDIWAKFLQHELNSILKNDTIKKDSITNKIHKDTFIKFRRRLFAIPINQELNKGLKVIIEHKANFSRQRWINIVESYLRYYLFTSNFNKLQYCHNLVERIIENKTDNITLETIYNQKTISINDKRKNLIEGAIRKHLFSNIFLYLYLEKCGVDIDGMSELTYEQMITTINKESKNITVDEILKLTNEIIKRNHSEEMTMLNMSTTKNMKEFFEYIGRKREITNYNNIQDINYLFIKDSTRDYILKPGIGLTYSLVLIASKLNNDGMTTISAADLSIYFKSIGLNISTNEISDGYIGNQLNLLGLFIETPDSEGGIQIKKPLA